MKQSEVKSYMCDGEELVWDPEGRGWLSDRFAMRLESDVVGQVSRYSVWTTRGVLCMGYDQSPEMAIQRLEVLLPVRVEEGVGRGEE